MKRRNSVFIALAALLIIAVVAILASWVVSWKNQNIPTPSTTKRMGYEKAVSLTHGTPIPTQIKESKETIENFGSPDNWLYFNRDYQNQYRRFRFKYPAVLEVIDIDSGEIQLKKNKEFCLTIDEAFPLTEFYKGNTPDEKFKEYYFYKEHISGNYPELTFERIDLGENAFLYKVILGHSDIYLGEINRYGIEIVDHKKLPEDIVLEIIRSTEFK